MDVFHGRIKPKTRTIVASFRESESRHELLFDRLVQFAKDPGDEYRAQHVGARTLLRPTRGMN